VFRLKDSEELNLFEKHADYHIVAQTSDQPYGLRIERTFDGRSFGSGLKNETYFVPAQ